MFNTSNKDLYDELKTFKYFEDLLDVGVRKMVGYLPLSTMIEYGGKSSISKVIEWAESLNFHTKIITKGHTNSGALYVWEESNLSQYLVANKIYFSEAKVPTTPLEYIQHIEKYFVDDKLKAYELVGRTFADERWK